MLLYVTALRSKEFFGAVHADMTGGIFYEKVLEIISGSTVQSIVAIFLIFVQAWLINSIVIRNKLAREITLLPGIFYIILMSILPEFLGLSPILIANTFLILAYGEMSNIYRKPKSAVFLFNTGLFLSIATLIYFPFVIFFLVGIIGIIILNSVSVKFILQIVSGFIVPFFLTYTVLLLGNQPDALWSNMVGPSFSDKMSINNSYHLYLLLGMGVVVLVGIFSYNSFMLKKSIQSQKKIDILFWTLLFCAGSYLLMDGRQVFHLQILAFPLAVIIHMSFMKIKNYGIAELLHLIILATLFTLHFSLHLHFYNS